MRLPRWNILVCLGLMVACCGTMLGCPSSNDVLEAAGVPLANVGGTWNHQISNGDAATFANCTGDATVLDGQTWNQAQSLTAFCDLGASFTVTQNLAALVVVPQNVTCSDGSSAMLNGVGVASESSVDVQFDAAGQNVNSQFSVDGPVNGSAITLSQSSVSFSGSFSGSCDISPALVRDVNVQ